MSCGGAGVFLKTNASNGSLKLSPAVEDKVFEGTGTSNTNSAAGKRLTKIFKKETGKKEAKSLGHVYRVCSLFLNVSPDFKTSLLALRVCTSLVYGSIPPAVDARETHVPNWLHSTLGVVDGVL